MEKKLPNATLSHSTRIRSQVKGVHYSLEKFLGNDVSALDLDDNNNAVPSPTSLLRNPEVNSLFHCLIYLAPGDYHRYHSPADWMVEERKHFPGELFSVSPGVTRWMKVRLLGAMFAVCAKIFKPGYYEGTEKYE